MGICVGIATRDAEKNLPDCLRSLVIQTVSPDEYVICIGPSSDKTEELIQEFVEQITEPTMVIYDRDGIGTGYARKAIVENSTQEYIAWADSDHIHPPNWIDMIIKIAEKDKFDCLGYSIGNDVVTLSEAINMRESDKFPDPIDASLLEQTSIPMHTVKVVRREAAIEVGNYDPYFSRGQGLDLYVRLDNNGGKMVGYEGMNVYHVWNGISLKKDLSNGVFLKFLYKYGLDYIFLSRSRVKDTVAFLLRSCVALSFPLFGTCIVAGLPTIVPILVFLGGASGLVCGLILARSTTSVTLTACIRQFGRCFGEWYTLYKILTTRDKPKRGYGKKFLRKR